MPSYRVTKPAFIDGKLHGPGTRRTVITRSRPYKKDTQPSAVELIREGDKPDFTAPAPNSPETPAPETPADDNSTETL